MANLIANAADPVVPKDNTTGLIRPIEAIQKIGEETGLPDFYETGQHPDAPPDFGTPGVGTATSPIYFALDLFRYVVSGIALIVSIIAAVNLVSTASEEEAGKAKTTLLVGIIGLLVIQLADTAVKKMFFGEQGQALEEGYAPIYAEETVNQIRGIIGFVEAFVGVMAVFVIVLRGFTLMTSAGEEEEITKAKTHILWALFGVAAIILSEVIVRGVIFPEAGNELPDINRGRFVIITIINYLSGFISIFAFATLFYGGYRYVVSAGNEEETEKFKKIIMSAALALLLTLGAFALVNTLVKFEPETHEEDPLQPEITDEIGETT